MECKQYANEHAKSLGFLRDHSLVLGWAALPCLWFRAVEERQGCASQEEGEGSEAPAPG